MRRTGFARYRTAPRRAARRGLFRKVRDLFLAIAILALFALVAARFQGLETRSFSGTVRIADGDSLSFGTARIRLRGIDAPELDQTCAKGGVDYPCGRLARDALARLAAGGISCEGSDEDRYGRLLARCAAGGGIDINEAMVEQGWAVAYGDYRDAEHAARQAGRGLWAGTFDRPQDWRRVRGGLAESEHDGLGQLLGWLRGMFWPLTD